MYRSATPKLPGRVEKKKSVSRTDEISGERSPTVLLTMGPRLTGSDHTSSTLSRVETHRSLELPNEPGRFELMNISNPSCRIEGDVDEPTASPSSRIRKAGPKEPSAACS